MLYLLRHKTVAGQRLLYEFKNKGSLKKITENHSVMDKNKHDPSSIKYPE